MRLGVVLDFEGPTDKNTVGLFFVFRRPRLSVTKKRLLMIAALPLAVVVTVGVLAILSAMQPPSPGVTHANLKRVKIGMNRAHVEELFGERGISVKQEGDESDCLYWKAADGAEVWIHFSDDCANGDMGWTDFHESFFEKICRLLHFP